MSQRTDALVSTGGGSRELPTSISAVFDYLIRAGTSTLADSNR